jgi:hypothetical protein
VTYVSGVVVGAIETGYVGVNIVNSAIQVPVSIQSSLIIVPITGVVGGAVTISNTPLPITGYVSIGNVPSVIVNTGYIGASIVNTPTVTVGNTVNVIVVNTPSVTISNTPLSITGYVSIGNVPSVIVNTGYVGASIINTPTVLVGTTVNVNIVGSAINVPITGVIGGTVNVSNTPLPVLNAGVQSVLDTVVWLNTTFYTASPPSTTYSTAINVVPYETVSVLFNVVSLLGTGVTVSLNAYFTGLGMVYPLASQTLTGPGQALLTASVLPFNYIELGVTIYGSTVVLSAELVAKP